MSLDSEVKTNFAKEVAKLAPEVYSDLAKPATTETGKLLGRIPRAINAALAPLDIWIQQREFNVAKTKALLEKELENVEPEKIVPPEPYVAVPALQAIAYSMDSEALRSMYAKLIAKSMNVDTKNTVHPSFVEFIKQMSPIDAVILKRVCESSTQPFITIRYILPDKKGSITEASYVTWFPDIDNTIVSASLSLLEKNGLIDLHTGRHYVDDTNYKAIEISPWYKTILKSLESRNLEPEFAKGIIVITDLGRNFYNTCIRE